MFDKETNSNNEEQMIEIFEVDSNCENQLILFIWKRITNELSQLQIKANYKLSFLLDMNTPSVLQRK